MQKTDGSCPILEFSAGAREGDTQKNKKWCFLLQKPVHKKPQVFLCFFCFVFFPVGYYQVMLQEDT